jgi:hydroxymethylpyrimidine pyrophosphatase-like HAD family hydrolase
MDSGLAPADELRRFLADGRFAAAGAVFTDLDGTAVIEREGRIYLPPAVDDGLEHIRRLGRPVIANTLRFPRSVISVFADDWHRSTGTDLPLVSLKGSQIGRVVRDAAGTMAFEEWHAEPLSETEIREVLAGVQGMVRDGVRDLLVFHYPRDWRQGELIWTPAADHVDAVAAKYRSAARVYSSDVQALADTLLSHDMCMIFLLIDLPEDRRMAYQHTQRASFFTHAGVNKRTGAEAIARHLGIDLAASIGAGDAPPDDFLAAVGFAIVVGDNPDVGYKGLAHTVRVPGIAEFGQLLAVTGESLA